MATWILIIINFGLTNSNADHTTVVQGYTSDQECAAAAALIRSVALRVRVFCVPGPKAPK